MDPNSTPTIGELYPHLSKEQLVEAEQILEKYLALVLRIFERTESESNLQSSQLTQVIGTLPYTPPGSKSPV
jgi:hypothetical protein